MQIKKKKGVCSDLSLTACHIHINMRKLNNYILSSIRKTMVPFKPRASYLSATIHYRKLWYGNWQEIKANESRIHDATPNFIRKKVFVKKIVFGKSRFGDPTC